MHRFKTLIGPSLLGAALLGAGVTGVLAAKGPGGPGAGASRGGGSGGLIAFGTLGALTGTGATITTPGNTSVSVTLPATGAFTARSLAAATAGLKTGDQVAVRGTSVNGTNTASGLEYDTTAFVAATIRYTGTVSAATATSLTVTTTGGSSVTVQLDPSTRYGAAGAAAPTFASGQQVQVLAAQYTDGRLVAQQVRIPTATATATSTP
jgi:hypothetical protein